MKFGVQQQIRTTMTVMWSNIKIQNDRWSLLENILNAITRLPMDRMGRNLGWKCYNSSYDGTNWDDSWVVASQLDLGAAVAKSPPPVIFCQVGVGCRTWSVSTARLANTAYVEEMCPISAVNWIYEVNYVIVSAILTFITANLLFIILLLVMPCP